MPELYEVLPKLRESIPHELLAVRDIKGGGQWVYCPWRNLLKFLDLQTAGEWSNEYSDARYVFPAKDMGVVLAAAMPEEGEKREKISRILLSKSICEVHCTIQVLGHSREGMGSCPLIELSRQGNDGTQGDPLERAKASAFRDACEMWGIGVYLHRQKKDKGWQMELIKRVRAAAAEADQNWIAA